MFPAKGQLPDSLFIQAGTEGGSGGSIFGWSGNCSLWWQTSPFHELKEQAD